MAAAIRYTGLAVAAGGIGGNFCITPLASPMRPLIATQIGKTRGIEKTFLFVRGEQSFLQIFNLVLNLLINGINLCIHKFKSLAHVGFQSTKSFLYS